MRKPRTSGRRLCRIRFSGRPAIVVCSGSGRGRARNGRISKLKRPFVVVPHPVGPWLAHARLRITRVVWNGEPELLRGRLPGLRRRPTARFPSACHFSLTASEPRASTPVGPTKWANRSTVDSGGQAASSFEQACGTAWGVQSAFLAFLSGAGKCAARRDSRSVPLLSKCSRIASGIVSYSACA